MTQKDCAHKQVHHDTEPGRTDGTVRDTWRCVECKREFAPAPCRAREKSAKAFVDVLRKAKR